MTTGGPTDTSRAHEVTDAAQAERFVEAFIERVPVPSETAALVST